MPFRAPDCIEVKRIAGKGRGVFAVARISAGTVFERVPVLVMPTEEILESTDDSVLANYVFDWGKGTVALALGYGSLYNHSFQPNARYDDEGRQTKIFTALRDIEPGEELTVNYNGHEEDQTPVGFEVIGSAAQPPAEELEDVPPLITEPEELLAPEQDVEIATDCDSALPQPVEFNVST